MRNDKLKKLEVIVGFFLIASIMAFLFLALKASGLTEFSRQSGYYVAAEFDNVGDLKVRSPITIAGVRIGEVSSIHLDPHTFQANVVLRLNANQNRLPEDSSAKILTEGLLGSNYISITPGFVHEGEKAYLKNGSKIHETYPAIILENLIGQYMFNINKK